MTATMTDKGTALHQYKKEAEDELTAILSWWMNNMVDKKDGGFYGSVDNDNIPDLSAPKGIVLNSRILWTFSATCQVSPNESYLKMASRAFEYILDHFIDHEQGGVFWSVNQQGQMLDGRKQIYGLAFCMYSMAEYYKITGEGLALHFAKDLFDYIEQYSLDKDKGGYIEAFTRDWKTTDDLRLSDKDDNERKTMNTHLHIIEAYANLYRVWKDKKLEEKITGLLGLFESHFINKNNYHLNLFMDDDWNVRSSLQSFGHDIEAAWLLLECAEVVENKFYIDRYKNLSVKLTDAASAGLDTDGGLWYEYDPAAEHWIKEKHSWPQAEAMVGFFNAWQLTKEDNYLHYSANSFEFIKNNIKDSNKGEWFWGRNEDGSVMQKEKAGFWKCPYHSGRACLEISKRISLLSV